MSCHELERLFVSDAPSSAFAEHANGCRTCAALASDLLSQESLVSGLRAPVWTSELRRSLLSIPARTVSCETAPDWIAALAENEIAPQDRERLESHLSRCAGCAEATRTLLSARELVSPAPAPWLAGRIAARRPGRKASRWGWLLDPKAAIAGAYAATLIVMLLGWNPADLARKANVRGLEETSKAAASAAGASLVDRIGSFEERAFRTLQIVKGRFGGYGRAVLSNALNLVMKPEKEPASSRPRSGQDKGAFQKNETEIWTWRA